MDNAFLVFISLIIFIYLNISEPTETLCEPFYTLLYKLTICSFIKSFVVSS